MNYSNLSYELTKKITKETKKENGIYFTPPDTIIKNIEILKRYLDKNSFIDILEPSCGSCEYINYIYKLYPDKNITGIEYNKDIYDTIKSIENNNIKLVNDSYLNFDINHNLKYDLIIGNPPYYVMNKKDINQYYYQYFEGRPNIFILFIIKSLLLLKKDGILSFILPKNFINCLYYDKTRNYIYQNYKIIDVVECNDNYIETQQETILLIIQNNKININRNNNYVLIKNNYTIFSTKENITKLKVLYDNSTTLSNLNFKVSVGNIVWNQCKDILTNDTSKTRLIYSSDIKNNKLLLTTYNNKDKKNYINKEGITEPLLVINRGYGVGKYQFNYCLIDINEKYLVENHLICIKHIDNNIDKDELLKIYDKIIKSLKNDKTKQFIELYFGNNAMNTAELSYILPIYDI